MDALMDSSVTKNYLNEKVLGVAVVFFGFLYIPAFTHGYFWLWVFPFIAIVTFFLRTQLDHAIEKVNTIEDEGKRSWAMSRYLFSINIIQILACTFPFILALWLYHFHLIEAQETSGSDKALYGLVLSFLPESRLPKEIAFANGTVQVLLSSSYFMFVSLLMFCLFCFRKTVKARKVIFNIQLAAGDPEVTRWGKDDKYELLFTVLLFFVFLFFIELALYENLNIVLTSILLVLFISFSVFTSLYTTSRFFMQARKIQR